MAGRRGSRRGGREGAVKQERSRNRSVDIARETEKKEGVQRYSASNGRRMGREWGMERERESPSEWERDWVVSREKRPEEGGRERERERTGSKLVQLWGFQLLACPLSLQLDIVYRDSQTMWYTHCCPNPAISPTLDSVYVHTLLEKGQLMHRIVKTTVNSLRTITLLITNLWASW